MTFVELRPAVSLVLRVRFEPETTGASRLLDSTLYPVYPWRVSPYHRDIRYCCAYDSRRIVAFYFVLKTPTLEGDPTAYTVIVEWFARRLQHDFRAYSVPNEGSVVWDPKTADCKVIIWRVASAGLRAASAHIWYLGIIRSHAQTAS